ncbi:MAG: hypothetical protein WBH55_08245 [Bacteroidota bacterium]
MDTNERTEDVFEEIQGYSKPPLPIPLTRMTFPPWRSLAQSLRAFLASF